MNQPRYRSSLFLASLLVTTSGFAGCGYVGASSDLTGLKKAASGGFDKTTMDFSTVQQQVFIPRCVGCHGATGARAGVRLDSFEHVQDNLAGIRQTVLVEGSMPKGGPLTGDQTSLLQAWLDLGAPEKAQAPGGSAAGTPVPAPAPAPTPSAEPAPEPEPTFAYIKDVLFTQHACFQCHGAGKRVADIPLDTIDDLKIPGNELVVPGDPDGSELVQVLVKPVRGRMPPVSRDPGLSAADVAIVREWIKAGAKD